MSLYYSELLVNAMLAASTVSDLQGGVEVPLLLTVAQHMKIYNVGGTSSIDSVAQGRAFADEALRLLREKQDYPSLPRLQGIALLWVYEETFGNPSTAASLLEQLFELHASLGFFEPDPALQEIEGSEQPSRIQQAVSFIAWGFYGLDT